MRELLLPLAKLLSLVAAARCASGARAVGRGRCLRPDAMADADPNDDRAVQRSEGPVRPTRGTGQRKQPERISTSPASTGMAWIANGAVGAG